MDGNFGRTLQEAGNVAGDQNELGGRTARLEASDRAEGVEAGNRAAGLKTGNRAVGLEAGG